MNSTQALTRLQEGNKRFVAEKLEGKHTDNKRRKELLKGQEPFAIVLSCADSRIVPELAFDTGLGELFVVRVAGNIANTESIASIEYAVAYLETKLIVVLGHESCGAVTAAIKGGNNGNNLNKLLEHISPAIKQSGKSADVNEVARTNVLLTAKELVAKSTIIANAIKNKGLKILPAFYHLETGEVTF